MIQRQKYIDDKDNYDYLSQLRMNKNEHEARSKRKL